VPDSGALATVLGIVGTLSAVFVVWRGGGMQAWRGVAEGRAELLKQREGQLEELRSRLAVLEARPNVDNLAAAVDRLRELVGQQAQMIASHDENAEARWAETQSLVAGILERVDARIGNHEDRNAEVLAALVRRAEAES
jgi:hypothetical protein